MKTHRTTLRIVTFSTWAVVAFFVGGASLLGSTSARSAAVAANALDPPVPPDLRFQIGTVALMPDQQPAAFSYQTGRGKTGSSGERASQYARSSIDFLSGDPGLDMVLGPLGLIFSPVAATVGALSPNPVLPQEQLTAAEQDLVKAFRTAASQQQFYACLARTAAETRAHNLLLPGDAGTADTRLRTWIDELRLVPARNGGDHFFLTIRQQVSLSRTRDGAVIYAGARTYRSEAAPYIDWTRGDALNLVADTGYRHLARQLFQELLSLSDAPLLTGAGSKPVPNATRVNAIARTSSSTDSPQPASFKRMSADTTRSEPLGVVSFARQPHAGYTLPKDKEESDNEVIANLEYEFDGLHVHPNPAVAITAGIVAIPISLWNQGVAMLSGTPHAKLEKADTALRKAALDSTPHEDLAVVLAQQLTPHTAQPVVLVKNSPREAKVEIVHAKSVLEIQVTSSVLAAVNRSGNRSAMEVEAVATLRNLADGRVIYSCPVSYRSAPHHFNEWGKSDAALFRQTLKTAYATMSQALRDQLAARGFIPDARAGANLVAKN